MAAKKVVDFGPIGEKLVAMIGAARDAFNRHSRAGLDQFQEPARRGYERDRGCRKKPGGADGPGESRGQSPTDRLA